MKKVFGQLLTAHVFITIIVIILSATLPHVNDSLIIIGFITCVFYFYSGYWATKEKLKWYHYFGIAGLGLLLWQICFAISPHSMNYKRDNEAGAWFFYQLYIFVSSPLNFISALNEKYSLVRQLILDLSIPFFISGLQFLGGLTKLRYLKTDETN